MYNERWSESNYNKGEIKEGMRVFELILFIPQSRTHESVNRVIELHLSLFAYPSSFEASLFQQLVPLQIPLFYPVLLSISFGMALDLLQRGKPT